VVSNRKRLPQEPRYKIFLKRKEVLVDGPFIVYTAPASLFFVDASDFIISVLSENVMVVNKGLGSH
jgi:hypothetical protein